MVALPAPTANTKPLASTNAAAGLLLIHVPPPVPFVVNWLTVPVHIADDPLMVPAVTIGLTFTL